MLNRKIGWIGTGIMGSAMCGHLIDAGYEVVVSNRTPERARRLIERGATWADTPAELAAASQVVFSIVSRPEDVRQVVLGPQGIFVGAEKGTILVEMTTSEPSLAEELAYVGGDRGIHVLDAPVTGGDIGARDGTLSIMVGGPAEVLDEVRPLLELLGTMIVHQGGHGAGQRTKMANQMLIGGQMVAICEALLFAVHAGLDPTTVLTSVSAGSGAERAVGEPRTPHHPRRRCRGVLGRSLCEGPWHRPRGVDAHAAVPARARPRPPAVRGSPSAGTRSERHASPHPRACIAVRGRVAARVVADDHKGCL